MPEDTPGYQRLFQRVLQIGLCAVGIGFAKTTWPRLWEHPSRGIAAVVLLALGLSGDPRRLVRRFRTRKESSIVSDHNDRAEAPATPANNRLSAWIDGFDLWLWLFVGAAFVPLYFPGQVPREVRHGLALIALICLGVSLLGNVATIAVAIARRLRRM